MPSLLGLQVSYLVANLCVVDKSKNKQFLGVFGIGGVGGKGYTSMYGVNNMGREAEVFEEYKKLGGKKNRNEFLDEHDIFIEETLDIFVHGDMIRHRTRDDALQAVMEITNMSENELNLHFESEDNLGGYT